MCFRHCSRGCLDIGQWAHSGCVCQLFTCNAFFVVVVRLNIRLTASWMPRNILFILCFCWCLSFLRVAVKQFYFFHTNWFRRAKSTRTKQTEKSTRNNYIQSKNKEKNRKKWTCNHLSERWVHHCFMRAFPPIYYTGKKQWRWREIAIKLNKITKASESSHKIRPQPQTH